MNCSRFETLLSEYLDGLLDPRVRAAMDQHLESCSECPLVLTEVAELRDQLRDFPEVIVSESLVDRILEKTSGLRKKFSFWQDLVLPTLSPFMSQRFAFATVMMFVFISFTVNLVGPEFSALSYSNLSPASLVAKADRFSAQLYKRWLEFRDLKTRVGEEVNYLKEDLFGRLDYHLVSLLFRSYSETIEAQDEETETDQQGPEEEEKK
jgi:hypothetical protein